MVMETGKALKTPSWRPKIMREINSGDGNILKGLAAGLIGGLVASAVMNQFQKTIGPMLTGEEESHGAQSLQEGSPKHGIGKELADRGIGDPEDDAPERLANAISVAALDQELTEPEKNLGGTLLHYGFGASMGALYGIAADISPVATIGAGLPYGALVWLGADEGVVPLVGLSKTPEKYPASIHISALASHLVYGLTTEIVRKAVRKCFKSCFAAPRSRRPGVGISRDRPDRQRNPTARYDNGGRRPNPGDSLPGRDRLPRYAPPESAPPEFHRKRI